MLKDLPVPVQGDPNKELTAKQEALIEGLVGSEGKSLAEIAMAAGYGKGNNPESARVNAFEALSRPHVQKALRKRVNDKLLLDAVNGQDTVADLAVNARSERVRLEAALALLDRSGFDKPEPGVHINAGEMRVHIDLS